MQKATMSHNKAQRATASHNESQRLTTTTLKLPSLILWMLYVLFIIR